jgi:DnaJ-domain-containing protein 1
MAGFQAYAIQAADLLGQGSATLEDLLDALWMIAAVDGFHEAELAFLGEVATILGFDEAAQARIRRRHLAPAADDPWAVLGVEPGADAAALRAAYHALVQERLEGVREPQLGSRPSMAEFIDRRLLPAIRTCNSVAARGEGVSRRLSRSLNLLRTQVDVAVEAQNRDLLASMNRRARLQLRLQETVEGLSIAAITYYVVGLVGYTAKAVHRFWPALSVPIAQAVAIPVVAGCLWWALRRVRAGVVEHLD